MHTWLLLITYWISSPPPPKPLLISIIEIISQSAILSFKIVTIRRFSSQQVCNYYFLIKFTLIIIFLSLYTYCYYQINTFQLMIVLNRYFKLIIFWWINFFLLIYFVIKVTINCSYKKEFWVVLFHLLIRSLLFHTF